MAEANTQSLPTRTPPITEIELETILRSCIYITLTPKVEPSAVIKYVDIDIDLVGLYQIYHIISLVYIVSQRDNVSGRYPQKYQQS